MTWTPDLPYVITWRTAYRYERSIDDSKRMSGFPSCGCPDYCGRHIDVNGEKYDSTRVYFKSDRLDNTYKDLPCRLAGHLFSWKQQTNVLNYAVIQNAYQALVAEKPSTNAEPKLTLNQCIIDNAYDAGILAVQSSIMATNTWSVIAVKMFSLSMAAITSSIIARLQVIPRNYQLIKNRYCIVSNNTRQDNVVLTADLTAAFRNCIFWGEGGVLEDEVVGSKLGSNCFQCEFQTLCGK